MSEVVLRTFRTKPERFLERVGNDNLALLEVSSPFETRWAP
jgi:hypothetical protein